MTKLHFGIATIAYFGAAFLTGGMVFLGNSYRRLANTNEALSADIQLLVEAYTSSEKDFCLLAPAPDDWLIWEEMPYKKVIPQIQQIEQ
jgi:sarcosine oxidase gamma subunit